MRYQANISENLVNASKSQDHELVKDVVLDQVVYMIKDNPQSLIEALRFSNVSIGDNATEAEIASKVSHALYNNTVFLEQLSKLMVQNEAQPVRPEYSNAGADPITASMNALSAIQGTFKEALGIASKAQEKKIEEEKTKQLLYARLFGEEEKTNWIPIIAITGVLIIAGIVVWRVTKKK